MSQNTTRDDPLFDTIAFFLWMIIYTAYTTPFIAAYIAYRIFKG